MNTIRTSILRSGALAARTVSCFTLLRSIVRGLLGLAVLLLAHTASAQPWQTVDDYQYVAGQSACNQGLTVAPSGVVYACGYASDGASATPWHGLVMASADGGNTWSAPLDDAAYLGNAARDDGIVADYAGNLYVAGLYYFTNGNFHRFVRRSADGGGTWQTVDDLALGITGGTPLGGGSIAADAAGNVFVVVQSFNTTWTVRKGVSGLTFSTVDSFQSSSGAQAEAVFAHPTAGIFAVGYGPVSVKSGSGQAWLVRRSVDDGATWTKVDAYQASSGYAAEARGAGADAQGNIYVVGSATIPYKKSSIGHWLVRKSANGGATWTTVDDFAPLASQTAFGVVADVHGNLFVSGMATSTIGLNYWTVRESLGGTGAWTTVDTFSGYTAAPHAIAADGMGNIFVGGIYSPTSGAGHWLVRKN